MLVFNSFCGRKKKREKNQKKIIFSKKNSSVDVKNCLIRLFQTFRIFSVYFLIKIVLNQKGEKRRKNSQGVDTWDLQKIFIKNYKLLIQKMFKNSNS